MNRPEIEKLIREFAAEAAEARGLELVHVEFTGTGKQAAVRIYIDKEGGVNHEDCSLVSQEVEKQLDANDPISGRYVLEVSSPGIERGLYKEADYERFSGEKAKMRTHTAIGGQRNFAGTIVSFEDGEVVLDDRTSGVVRIPFADIARANLEYDVARELKEAKRRRS